MNRSVSFLPCFLFLAGSLWAQASIPLHNLEIGGGGFFPSSGYRADNYSAGPALHPSYELRFLKPLGAEVGWIEAWLPGTSCDKFGCSHPRETVKFLNYGLRGHLPLGEGRVDLSIGLGGGQVWYQRDSSYYNSALFQYSAKASVALDRSGRFRAAVTLRSSRDIGRPTQQWLSTTGSLIFGFGRIR